MAYGPFDVPLVQNNVPASQAGVTWQGGQGLFQAVGTFTTATLQFLSADGTTWLAVSAATTLSAVGSALFSLHKCQIRCVGAGGAAGFYASASTIPTTSS